MVGHVAFFVGPAYGIDARDDAECRGQPAWRSVWAYRGHSERHVPYHRRTNGGPSAVVNTRIGRLRGFAVVWHLCQLDYDYDSRNPGSQPGDAYRWRWASCRPSRRTGCNGYIGHRGDRDDFSRRDVAIRASARRLTRNQTENLIARHLPITPVVSKGRCNTCSKSLNKSL